MKLRNKKTREIKNVNHAQILIHFNDGNTECIKSLAKLNEEWEDYEEPKEYWYMENNGDIDKETYDGDYYEEKMQEIGNYFETEEEAKKAVKKLKAWKRLKDKGFRFEGIAGITNEIYFKAKEPFTHIMVDEYTADKAEKEYIDDLMLLFGGEE